mgnify:CR=1 FL=1
MADKLLATVDRSKVESVFRFFDYLVTKFIHTQQIVVNELNFSIFFAVVILQ